MSQENIHDEIDEELEASIDKVSDTISNLI